MLTILYVLMLTVFISYVLFIWAKYGIQKSISDSYYRLKDDKIGILFTLFCFGFAYPAAILGSNIYITPAAFLIIAVGVARAFKDNKWMRYTHLFCAYVGVLLAEYGIWVYYKMWYVPIIFIILSLTLMILSVKNKIFFIEILAFISICVVLGLNL